MVRKIKAVIALLEANGWAHIRTRGDHRIFRKDGEPRSIPIPGSPSDDLAIGTLKSILKQAGLSESDFDKIWLTSNG